ncbi:MAG: 4Fe-4S binding protein [Coriobacteriales bacterium]
MSPASRSLTNFISVDGEKCVHCGACIVVCSSEAYSSPWLPRRQRPRRRRRQMNRTCSDLKSMRINANIKYSRKNSDLEHVSWVHSSCFAALL